jgi:hypothetical protein
MQTIAVVSVAATSFALAGCGNAVDGPADLTPGASADTSEAAAAPAATLGQGRDVGGLSVLGPAYTEGALGWHGGGGGSYTGHVTPEGIIYAVQTNSGSLVDHISFAYYQPSGADNLYRAGDNWGSVGPFGGGGGGANPWWYCPGGQGVIGIRGNSGSLVDRVGVICGNVNNPDPNSPSNTYSPLWGGGGGGWFGEDKCTAGRIVDAFNVRSGAQLDGIQAICVNAH